MLLIHGELPMHQITTDFREIHSRVPIQLWLSIALDVLIAAIMLPLSSHFLSFNPVSKSMKFIVE